VAELVDGRDRPVLVALDGRGGAGKSTLAGELAATTGVVVIDGDDFYSGRSAQEWDAMTPAERVEHCLDWRRQRSVLETLYRGEVATWQPYDWDADDGGLADRTLLCDPTWVVLLEGAYSARPELADLLDLRVLLSVPDEVRREQLRAREGERYRAEWEARWAAAEDYYFEHVMPPVAFDLVLG
jgi:uridine kinase